MSAQAQPLLFEARERRLEALDALDRKLWLGGLTNSQGTLEPRLQSLAALRDGLLAGSLPPPAVWDWPPPPIAPELHDTMSGLGLAGYCKGLEELTDTVLMSLLFHLDFIVDYRDRGAGEAQAASMAIEAFAAEWQELCGQFDELVEVFGMLPDDGKNNRWDELRGLLRSSGWQDVLRIRQMLERLPELSKIIRTLGRAVETDEPDASRQVSAETIEQAVLQHQERRTVHVPDLPGETRGIHRSDRIARMLPAEAMLLGHPSLRLLWHARRAERTLLSYEDDDRMEETFIRHFRVSRLQPAPQPGKRQEMGPILVCVDTSGSMQGGAEAVAKATVLEAMRTAHAQHRPCHVFAFSGPEEILELELDVDHKGIDRLIRFLGQTFSGGTEISGPLEKVLAKLEDQRWRVADLLVASDGEFGINAELADRLDTARRELGLRVQGVQIGDRETPGFRTVADHIYAVRDWRRFGAASTKNPLPGDGAQGQL